jgi:hypothetical protein
MLGRGDCTAVQKEIILKRWACRIYLGEDSAGDADGYSMGVNDNVGSEEGDIIETVGMSRMGDADGCSMMERLIIMSSSR